MRRYLHWACVAAFGFLLVSPRTQAAQHRATRLGDPETRFAPPLTTPEDLRALFANEVLKPDVLSIARQGGWTGDIHDLWRAARTAAVHEVHLPKGSRLPYMSSRDKGRPVALKDVLWAGNEPLAAFEFTFTSRGRQYRVVTPKACSNFWIEDAGAAPPPFVARPALVLTKSMPPEVPLCASFEATVTVRNAGNVPLTGVVVTEALPAGLRTVDGKDSLRLEAGSLSPGAGMEFKYDLKPALAGPAQNRVSATCAEGATAEAVAETVVVAPELTLDCSLTQEGIAGRPLQACLTVRNTGNAPETQVTVTLSVPAAISVAVADAETNTPGQVTWRLPTLAPGAEQKLCATLASGAPGEVSLKATAQGECQTAAQAQCVARVVGIAAVLLEVVDLDDPIEVGSNETYEIRVTNQGSAPLNNVKLVCTLEPSQQFVSGSGASPVRAVDRLVATESLPVLEPKARVVWRVVVKALEVGDVRFAVALTSDESDRPVEETEATHQY